MSNTTPRSSGKTMSSRLLTMKFMQRAAASAPPPTPPLSSQNAKTPSSKRQKTSHIPESGTIPTSDLDLIQAAIGEEGEKREKAIEKLAAETGETKWVLSTADTEKGEESKAGVRVEVAGYSDINQDAWRPALLGRRSFGKFNREIERQQNSAVDDSSSSGAENSNSSKEDGEDDEDGEDSNDSAGTGGLRQASKEDAIRCSKAQHLERRRQRKAKKAEMARLAEQRRKKEVKLNKLVSISGGGGEGHKPNGGSGDKVCFKCGLAGHEKRDCPKKGKIRNPSSAGNLLGEV